MSNDTSTVKKISFVTMKLSDIKIDEDWNERSPARTRAEGEHADSTASEEGEDKSLGITGLGQNMALVGQNTPVDVCLLPEECGPNAGTPWLTTGFRRAMAVAALFAMDPPQAVQGLQPGEIRVCLREGLSLEEIRLLNIGENVREGIITSDRVYGVMDLMKINPSLTQKEVAQRLNMVESHVSHLVTIGKKLSPKLFKEWRESVKKPLGKNAILNICQLETEKEQIAAYKDAVEKKNESENPEKDPSAWQDAAAKRAQEFGFKLGTLMRLKMIKLINFDIEADDADNFLNREVACDLLNFKKTITKVGKDGVKKSVDVSEAVHRKLAGYVNDGILEGLQDPEEETEEETAEREAVEAAAAEKQAQKDAKKAEKAAAAAKKPAAKSAGKNSAAASA